MRRANLLTSLLLVFPLFIAYQIGVLALPEVYNGADLITAPLIRVLQGRLWLYLAINGGLALAFVIAVLFLRRKNEFHPRQFIPVVIESSLYAVSMGFVIVFLMTRVLHVAPLATTQAHPGLLGKILLSFGAGVHEELIFRLFMFSAIAWLGTRALHLKRGWSLFAAYLVSALLFSAAHHVIGGEPWQLGVFVYRTLCGLVFAAIFQLRGFATAVYTHAFYDIFVLVFK
jgi:membrane protease YdiL (CAAX protease family)